MRIAALLNWFDEDPAMLKESVASWGALCDTVVALDGPYEGFPTDLDASPAGQVDAILFGARAGGMDTTVASLAGVSEADKRTRLFRLGDAANVDWFLVIDADEVLVRCRGVRDALASTSSDVAEVSINNFDGVTLHQPRLLRATPGIAVVGVHWRYVAPGGRVLWADSAVGDRGVWRLGLRDSAVIEHARHRRPDARVAAQKLYYETNPER